VLRGTETQQTLPASRLCRPKDIDDLRVQILNSVDDYVAIDTETNGLRWQDNRAFGVAFAWDDQQTFIRNTDFGVDDIGALISEIYESDKTVLMHNALFDMHMIRETYDVQGYPNKLIDTLLVAHLLDTGADHTLKGWATRVYGNEVAFWEGLLDEYRKKYKITNYEMLPADILDPYAGYDAYITKQLAYRYVPQVMVSCNRLFELEHELIPVIYDMEKEGVKIDLDYIKQQRRILGLKKRELEKQLFSLVGRVLNPASPKQLADYLYGELGLTISERNEGKDNDEGGWTEGTPKTDEKALNTLDHPVVDIIQEWRKVNKVDSTYFAPYQKLHHEGRIHSHYNAAGTVTGRLSSSNPNGQNVPKEAYVRRMFIPDSQFIAIDWSQIELRMQAHVTKEPALLEAIEEGTDLHALIASNIYKVALDGVVEKQRNVGKTVNFAILYGIGQDALSDQIDTSSEQAGNLIAEYWKARPVSQRLFWKLRNEGDEKGFVQTIFGRKLTLGSNSRSAFNYVIQGSSGDLLKIALIRCWKYAKANGGSIRNTIHDEIVFDNLDPDTHIPHLVKLMEDFNLQVPIVANASVSDKSWGDVEPWQPI